MLLMPKYISSKLPALYSYENEQDPMVPCKFFAVFTTWTWYVIEFDGEDLFFWLCCRRFPGVRIFQTFRIAKSRGANGFGH